MTVSVLAESFVYSFSSLSPLQFKQIETNLSDLTDVKRDKGAFSERQILRAVIRVVSDPQDLDETDLKILLSQTLVSDFAQIVCKLKKDPSFCLLRRFTKQFTSPQIKSVDLKLSLAAACRHIRSPLIAYFDPQLSVAEAMSLRADVAMKFHVLHQRPDFSYSPKSIALEIEYYQNSILELLPFVNDPSDQHVLKTYIHRLHKIVKEVGLQSVDRANPFNVHKWALVSFTAIQNEFMPQLFSVGKRVTNTLSAGLKTAIVLNPKILKEDETDERFMIVNPGPWAEINDSTESEEESSMKEAAFLAYSEMRLKYGEKKRFINV